MKLLIVGDIHTGTSRMSTSRPGIVRQANTQAEEKLSSLVAHFNNQHFDLIVHTGDALREVHEPVEDKKNLQKTLSLLSKITADTIHLIGNHELHAFSKEQLKMIYSEFVESPKFYGMKEYPLYRIVWLDLDFDQDKKAFLSTERIEWLQSLPKDKPLLIFSHYSLVPIDAAGSFYFEKDPSEMYLKNAHEVLQSLKNHTVLVCINAHVHLLTHQVVDKAHHISAPSFTENIAGGVHTDINPGVYSVLELDGQAFTFTSYSDAFCFGKIQGALAY